MNQYINHTKSDEVQSDIRAISALQEQCSAMERRLQALETVTEKLAHYAAFSE